MDKVFTGLAYGCVEMRLYSDGSNYILQISDDSSISTSTPLPDKDKWISETMKGRKRYSDRIYSDENIISEMLLRILLKERISLLNTIIDKITTYAEQKVKREVARTLKGLLEP